ncbi:MAG: ATPase [Eubacterium sp.]|jgi:V/A-type H+-transporting ATPase subunit I|nr:ATPase [Eubacterium sp.]
MAVEKMSLVAIEGVLKRVNRTLMTCCESNYFHIVPSAHTSEGKYSSQSFKSLKGRNHFASLIKRAQDIACDLDIKLRYMEYDDIEMNVSVDFDEYLTQIEIAYTDIARHRDELKENVAKHTAALQQVENFTGLSSNFNEIFALKYIKVRFGRMPVSSHEKLKYYEDKDFLFFPFETQGDYIWGVYFTPSDESVQIDDVFKSLYFERVRIPEYVAGSADDARNSLMTLIADETRNLNSVIGLLGAYKTKVEEHFIKVFCKLKALGESFELRANVSVINNRFFLSGYIPSVKADEFKSLISGQEGVSIQMLPPDSDPSYSPPVRLKNNRLFRPFEMFVEMYGLPSYGQIDPTPIFAITYFIIYGIMFGDVGQGFLISLFGFLLHKFKKAKLGPIMERIGISSMLFGFIYGSIFGNEHIIEPFFQKKEIYTALGFDSPPENIFGVSSVLIIASLVIGVVIILITIFLSIISRLREHNFEKGFFGANGICGFVMYSAVVAGAAGELAFDIKLFSPKYVIFLILTPLLLMFFKEPLAHLTSMIYKKINRKKINRNMSFIRAINTYSNAVADIKPEENEDFSIEMLYECKYISYQYGRMTYESYQKLKIIDNRDFFFFPFESDDIFVNGIYISSREEFPSVDKIFSNLGFEKMKLPSHIADIERQSMAPKDSRAEENVKKVSIGNFVIEGFIDLFETALTYLSNTISFMRIAGFIMSHAGLMLVVNILAGGAEGTLKWWLVQIIGNLFVLGLEGFLVGIQVVRLEFYEMFSRYYEGKGTPFKPTVVDLKINN